MLGEPRYVARAEAAAEALLDTLVAPQGELLHVARHGQAKLAAYSQDYAALILGLVELYRASGDARWRAEAANLADAMIARLWDSASGGFFDTQPSVEHLLVRRKEQFDGAMPSGSSLAARALTELAAMGFPGYAAYAAGTVRAFAGQLHEHPAARTYLLWALADYRRFGLAEDVELPQQRLQALRSDSYVRMQAEVVSMAEGGSRARLVVNLKIDEGWHINANPASLDFLTPTTVTASIGAEALDLKPAYPPGKKIPTPLSEETIAVYEGEVTIAASLPNRVREAGPGEALSVSAQVQTCNDQGRCLTPAELKATLPLSALGR